MTDVLNALIALYLIGSGTTSVLLILGPMNQSIWQLVLAVWFWPVFWYHTMKGQQS